MHTSPETLPIPAAGEPGAVITPETQPSLWRQVDALRELLQEGSLLLGEVLLFTRSAEGALATLEHEKAALDREREQLREEKEAACREREEYRQASQEQARELALLKARLEAISSPHGGEGMADARHTGKSLQKALQEAEQRCQELEAELGLSRTGECRVEESAAPEPRLRLLENELEQTRLILAGERLRRNRAISLIKPRTQPS